MRLERVEERTYMYGYLHVVLSNTSHSKAVRKLVRVGDCEIVWVDGWASLQ